MARKDLVGTKWLLRDFDAKIITPLQKGVFTEWAKKMAISESELDEYIIEKFGKTLDELSEEEAGALIPLTNRQSLKDAKSKMERLAILKNNYFFRRNKSISPEIKLETHIELLTNNYFNTYGIADNGGIFKGEKPEGGQDSNYTWEFDGNSIMISFNDGNEIRQGVYKGNFIIGSFKDKPDWQYENGREGYWTGILIHQKLKKEPMTTVEAIEYLNTTPVWFCKIIDRYNLKHINKDGLVSNDGTYFSNTILDKEFYWEAKKLGEIKAEQMGVALDEVGLSDIYS